MKNSLFKRVVAAAAAVPMALTQCLTVNTFAVEDADIASAAVAADDAITLDSFLYIAPDDADQASNWNTIISSAVDNAVDNGGLSGVIETESLYKKLIALSGKYAKLTENITNGLGDIEYKLNDSRDIVLTLNAKDVVDAFEGDAKEKINKEINKLKSKYAGISQFDALVEDLDNLVVFDGVEIEGVFTATISLEDLLSNKISANVVFEDTVGGEKYNNDDIARYALDKLEELKEAAAKNVSAIAEKYDVDTTAIIDEINEAEDYYASLIKKAYKKAAAFVFGYSFNPYSGDFADYSVLAQALNAKLEAEGVYEKLEAHNIDKKLPTSGAAFASDATVVKYFEKAINKLNEVSPVAVNIEAAELGAFMDELTDISVSIDGSKVSFSASFPDDEAEAVKAYWETQNKEVKGTTYKTIDVVVDYEGSTGVDAQLDIKRVIELEDKETTTTTSTTTSTTTTTSSTTTSSETTTSDTTTSSTTTSSTTTSTDTTTSSSTTTSTDTTTSSSTTTSTDTTTSTTTTTYVAVAGVYVDIEAEDGFYTNIDDSFAKEQVSNLSLFVKYNTISVDENGIETIVDESVSSAYDITGSFKFSTTPGAAYDSSKTSFLYDIGLLYNGMDIVDQYGNTVITDGAILRTSTDGIVTVPAYIGLKGDADLDNKITSRDAAMVLDYYANLSSGADAATIEFSVDSDLVSGPDSIYDNFAAFLADVDTAIDPSAAWKTGKSGRRLLASDAGAILTYYAYIQNAEPGKAAWAAVLGNTQA